MEEPKERRWNMKGHPCIPRIRGSTRKNNRLLPMSLLDRIREAVFRLIMLSALSKTTHDSSRSSFSNAQRSYYTNDPLHNEAVADCIEFIKKSATADENRNSSASSCSTSIDAASEVVIHALIQDCVSTHLL